MRKLILTAVAGTVLATAAPAGATTYTVFAGEQTRPPVGARLATLNAYFPASLKVHRGDTVTFVSQSFHTATYAGSRPLSSLSLAVQDGGTYSSAPPDAAGVPFFFASLPSYVNRSSVFGPSGGRVIADNKVHNSGALSPPNGRYTFSFPKAGTYVFHCMIHEGMEMRVRVLPASAVIPGPGAVAAAAARQMASAWNAARELGRAPAGTQANTVVAGPSKPLPGGEVTLIEFRARKLTVPEGTTVTFESDSKTELHDFVFGPVKWLNKYDRKTSKNGGANPIEVYGTDPVASTTTPRAWVPGLGGTGAYSYDGTSHGNGVFAPPLLLKGGGSFIGPTFAESTSVTFPKAGTYHYFCLIHGPQMSGDIVVTPASG